VSYLFIKLGQRLLPPLLPVIIDDLGVTPFAAGIALSLLAIVRAFSQYPSGRASDQLSRKTVLLPALGFGLFGLMLLLASTTYLIFLFGVTTFGVGLGLFDPSVRGLISDLFVEKRGQAFGLHTVAGDLAGVIAALFSIVIVTSAWQTAFLPSVVFLLPIPLLLLRWNVHESVVVRRFEAGIFVTVRRLLEHSEIRLSVIAYSLIIFASSGGNQFLAAFLIEIHGFSVELAGAMFILLYGIGSFVKPIAGWLSDYIPRLIIVSGSVLLAGVSLLLVIVAPTRPVVVAAIIGYAFGQRAFPPPFQAFLMDQFPDDSMGGDLGALRSVYMAVGSLGPAYVGFIATRFSYPVAYTTMVFCFVVTGVIVLRLAS
jgi:MFS family permease